MLNIVLGTTLGLNMAVVRFFGDYLDLECYRMENNTREEDWLELSYGRLERMLYTVGKRGGVLSSIRL